MHMHLLAITINPREYYVETEEKPGQLLLCRHFLSPLKKKNVLTFCAKVLPYDKCAAT